MPACELERQVIIGDTISPIGRIFFLSVRNAALECEALLGVVLRGLAHVDGGREALVLLVGGSAGRRRRRPAARPRCAACWRR